MEFGQLFATVISVVALLGFLLVKVYEMGEKRGYAEAENKSLRAENTRLLQAPASPRALLGGASIVFVERRALSSGSEVKNG